MELPVATELARIVFASQGGAVVVTAPPGSGKTTLVPSAILDDLAADSSVLLLQPRRIAARSVARWIAHLRGCELGDAVGYQVRFDRCDGAATRLLVVTTGILLRRFADDPLLDGVGAVVLDEFHERSLEMDLALGMLHRIRTTLRPELRLIVMSATLAAEPIAHMLAPCPIITSTGRRFPVEIRYAPRRDARPLEQQVATAAEQAIAETTGHLLVFLPGVGEILRTRDSLQPWADRQRIDLRTLFGEMPAEQQDAVLQTSSTSTDRKLILATNVAETSLTIDGVTAVIDSGLQRQLRFAAEIGLPRLELTSISQASADQRAGRAGRTAPGICFRLWERASHNARPTVDLPEILRGDLSEAVLQLCLWGEREIAAFPWLTPPTCEAVETAKRLLRLLGAIDPKDRVTELGKRIARLPAHPRLARLILAGAEYGVLREASLAAALLSERDPFRVSDRGPPAPLDSSTHSDVADRVFALQRMHAGGDHASTTVSNVGAARTIFRTSDQFFRMAQAIRSERAADPESALQQALLRAFPDRLTKLRSASQDRGVMVGGRGVRLEPPSRVRGQPLFLSIDVNDGAGEARVRLASAIERAWLMGPSLRTVDESFFNPSRNQVEARRRTYWDDLMLEESPVEITNAIEAAELLARNASHMLERVLPDVDEPAQQFRKRVQWLSNSVPDLQLPALGDEQIRERLPEICRGMRSIEELRRTLWLVHFQNIVGYERLAEIDRLAPARFEVPSGNRLPIEYSPDNPPVLAVRIQELFGMPDTPRVAGGRVAVVLHLLGPNYRPQQITSDLASFWSNTYPGVMKELRRRYPKHAWPDNPLDAKASRSGLKRDS